MNEKTQENKILLAVCKAEAGTKGLYEVYLINGLDIDIKKLQMNYYGSYEARYSDELGEGVMVMQEKYFYDIPTKSCVLVDSIDSFDNSTALNKHTFRFAGVFNKNEEFSIVFEFYKKSFIFGLFNNVIPILNKRGMLCKEGTRSLSGGIC